MVMAAWLVQGHVWGRTGARRASVVSINSWPSFGGCRLDGRDGVCPALLERIPLGTLTPLLLSPLRGRSSSRSSKSSSKGSQIR